MKHRKFIPILYSLFFASISFASNTSFNSVYADESEENNIIEISSSKDLYKMEDPSYKTANFILKNDINFNADTSWQDVVEDYSTNGFRPINANGNIGFFDGCGYTISNFVINRDTSYVGLFSDSSLEIRNLFIENASVSGQKSCAALVGKNTGLVENVHITNSTINGDEKAGGLIAENYGEIDNCSFNGNVQGKVAGGLIAENYSNLVKNSSSDGAIKGHYAGGLIGYAVGLETENEDEYLIQTSYSSMTVTAQSYESTSTRLGGFVSSLNEYATIKDCYSLFGMSPIASGTSTGVSTLNSIEFGNQEKLEGLDFKNYFAIVEGKLAHRNIAVTSNNVQMGNVKVRVESDKNYYLTNEAVTLNLYTGDIDNLLVTKFLINDEDKKEELNSNTYTIDEIKKSVFVTLEVQYGLRVEVNKAISACEIVPNKQCYSANEEIIIEIKNMQKDFSLNSLQATYNGKEVTFEKIENNKYKVNLNDDNLKFTSNSLLYIDASFDYLGSTINPWMIVGIVGIAVLACLFVFIFVIVKKKLKKFKSESIENCLDIEEQKVYIKYLLLTAIVCPILGLCGLAGVVLWLLILLDVFVVTYPMLLVIIFPIISAIFVLVISLIIRKYLAIKSNI